VPNKKTISVNSSGVDIKSLDRVPVNIIPKLFLKRRLSNVEDGAHDDILWDNSEQSGEGASSSENENVIEGSLDKLPDQIKKMERNVHVVKILNVCFILVYFTLFFTLNVF
jgi:hypothetical protein